MLTHTRLREVLEYDPATGSFRWKQRLSNRIAIGDEAGVLNKTIGYRQISIDGADFWAHRLAWFYVSGGWPSESIDHIDGDQGNNRLMNLREATHAQNMHNARGHAGHSSRFKGVSYSNDPKRRKRWVAQIMTDGRKRCIGRFATEEEARCAYNAAAVSERGEFARIA